MDLRNGRITNFSRGIVTTDECTRMTIESVDLFGNGQCGMEIGQQSSIWNPPRQKMGFIRNCFIAGNSVSAPGRFAAIELDACAAFVVEGNRFGYEAAHDGVHETTQGPSVRIGARANSQKMEARRQPAPVGGTRRSCLSKDEAQPVITALLTP